LSGPSSEALRQSLAGDAGSRTITKSNQNRQHRHEL
jgi:hypothetical protein